MSVHRNIIPNYNQQDATFLGLFISTDALHVSGCSSAHHQKHITVHTVSGIVNTAASCYRGTDGKCQQDETSLDLFIFTDAIHVSGGSSAHHQEHTTVNTASGIVNQYCCQLLQWKRWNEVPSLPL